jgi:hypothetical protein
LPVSPDEGPCSGQNRFCFLREILHAYSLRPTVLPDEKPFAGTLRRSLMGNTRLRASAVDPKRSNRFTGPDCELQRERTNLEPHEVLASRFGDCCNCPTAPASPDLIQK